jgi:type IV secretory pathway TraG/TraD family ATPase VirD4
MGDPALAWIAVGLGLDGALWTAAALSSRLSGHQWQAWNPIAPITAFAHFSRPSQAWGSAMGPATLYWAISLVFALAYLLAGLLSWRGMRSRPGHERDPLRTEGMADRAQIRSFAGRRAALRRASVVRPSLSQPRASDVGFFLGRSRGVECWASVEDSVLLVGPPRSGKGRNVVIPTIVDAPGAVVTTSTRPDNLTLTLAARGKRGPVAVFDPQGIVPAAGLVPAIRWSPLRGCQLARTAISRATALVADPRGSGVENGNFWYQQTLTAVRCLLHAASLDGRTPADLYKWSHAAAGAKEAVAILTRNPAATPGWDRALDAIISSDQRTRDSVWAMVANAFAPLADPAVLESVSPEGNDAFLPDRFISESGTLYLLGTASGATATANLVASLIEDMVEAARRLAARSAGGRLEPPLALVLDEAANYPLPSLPALMSEGGGSSITTLAVIQSLSQARDRWGRDAAGAIWDSAVVKMVLGGSSNADDLTDISRLVGERDTPEHSETIGGGRAGRSVSTQNRSRPILDPASIRRIPVGHGLLLLRSAPPIMMRLRPWTARPDAADLASGRRAFEIAMRAPDG